MPQITRRKFMGSVAGAAVAAAASGRRVAANDRINVGFIGLGGQGKYNLKAIAEYDALQVVALCDVDSRLAGAAYKAFPDVPTFTNYHELLETVDDLDAVVVSTPDHHHAFATVAALERGKHVYCEKPLTHSVWEARRVGEAARAAGTATQMGNTGQASDGARRLKEYLDAGAIGSVREVHVWTNRPIWPQGLERPEPPMDVPPTLDWDRWLGPAPERPFHSLYHPFDWRGWWDFGTGAVGDIACHRFAPIFYALELEAPIAVEAHSTANNNESYPSASLIRFEFPARGDKPPVSIHWYDGGLKPFRPKQLDGNTPLDDDGAFYVGDDGVMMNGQVLRSDGNSVPEPPRRLPRSPGHWEEWIAACQGVGPQPGMSFAEKAGPLTEAVLLGNVALRVPKRLEWDSAELRFSNDDTANDNLRREYRDGWSL